MTEPISASNINTTSAATLDGPGAPNAPLAAASFDSAPGFGEILGEAGVVLLFSSFYLAIVSFPPLCLLPIFFGGRSSGQVIGRVFVALVAAPIALLAVVACPLLLWRAARAAAGGPVGWFHELYTGG